VIDANGLGYVGYATHMAGKLDSVTKEKRPAIWLGKGVKYPGAAVVSVGDRHDNLLLISALSALDHDGDARARVAFPNYPHSTAIARQSPRP
jgi:hypothetical protein